ADADDAGIGDPVGRGERRHGSAVAHGDGRQGVAGADHIAGRGDEGGGGGGGGRANCGGGQAAARRHVGALVRRGVRRVDPERGGDHAAAGLAAGAILLAALTGVAAVTLLAQPARQRRARVPVGRALPIAWWPTAADPLPGLALGVGAPLAAGAAAAAYLFR